MILGQHLQKHSSLILERGSVRGDHHPVREQGIARRERMCLFLDFHEAHATTANGFQSFIVTQGGNIDTESAARFQNRNTWLKLDYFSVNDSFRQFRFFSLCSPESLHSSRTRDQDRAGGLP